MFLSRLLLAEHCEYTPCLVTDIVTGFIDDVKPCVGRSGVYVILLIMGGDTCSKALEALTIRGLSCPTSVGGRDKGRVDSEEILKAGNTEISLGKDTSTLVENLS